jgi:hypothetical protein
MIFVDMIKRRQACFVLAWECKTYESIASCIQAEKT